ncbi:MAG TPA: general secretion pathway protein GspG, partial [Rhodopirellula sp.]|nr:general secretion pathway protein GspG [Rhodopirellula sp.]
QTGLNGSQERGLNWVDGMPLYTGFNTILPPNRELVLSEARDDCWGVLPPSSYHQGGVNVAMVDGAVRFISDEIDAGSAHEPSVYLGSPNPPGSWSPFGVWGAMGTRSSSELTSFEKVP